MSWWSREGQLGPTESPEPGSSRKAQTKSHITLSQGDLFPMELNLHHQPTAGQSRLHSPTRMLCPLPAAAMRCSRNWYSVLESGVS